MQRTAVAALAVGLLASCTLADATIFNMGLAPSLSSFSRPSVAADGSRAAFTANTDQGARAFTFTPGITPQSIGLPTGGTSAFAAGMSADGLAVGGTANVGGRSRPFRWTSAAGFQLLPFRAGGTYANGRGFSGDGFTLVGDSDTLGNTARTATIWPSLGSPIALGALPGGTPDFSGYLSLATGASHDGSVAIGWSRSAGGERGFRWTAAGGMENLGTLPSGTRSYANAVDATGTIIAGASDAGGAELVAFRWTLDAGMAPLGSIPGLRGSQAFGMSAAGDAVVGVAGITAAEQRAFLWRADLGMVSLQTLLPSLGVDLTGWVLSEARGVSNGGSMIIGSGTFEGQARVWVAVIPGPSAVALLGLAVAAVSRRPRRSPA